MFMGGEESKRFCYCILQIKTVGDNIKTTKAINMILPVLSFCTHALNCSELLNCWKGKLLI